MYGLAVICRMQKIPCLRRKGHVVRVNSSECGIINSTETTKGTKSHSACDYASIATHRSIAASAARRSVSSHRVTHFVIAPPLPSVERFPSRQIGAHGTCARPAAKQHVSRAPAPSLRPYHYFRHYIVRREKLLLFRRL